MQALKKILGFVIPLLIVAGCAGNTMKQQEVAREFWSAMSAKDIAKAKTFAVAGTMEGVSASDDSGIDEVNLKPSRIENGQALVPTVLTGMKDGKRQTLSFNTVLVQAGDSWKVDFDKTTNSMLGFSMQEVMEGMGKAMGEAMQGVGAAVGKSLQGIDGNAQPPAK